MAELWMTNDEDEEALMFHPHRSEYERAERETPGIFQTWRDLMKFVLVVVVAAGVGALIMFALAVIALMIFGVV